MTKNEKTESETNQETLELLIFPAGLVRYTLPLYTATGERSVYIFRSLTHQLKESLCPEKVQLGEAELIWGCEFSFPGVPSPPHVHRQVFLLRRARACACMRYNIAGSHHGAVVVVTTSIFVFS